MTELEFAKQTLGYAFKEGQWDGDMGSLTDEEIIEEADHLEERAEAAYDQWKEDGERQS